MQSVLNTLIGDWRLMQSAESARIYRRMTIVFTALIVVVAVTGSLVPAGIGWDFANFYDTGRRIVAWQIADLYNPDSLINGAAPQGGLAFWGTPISALLYAPLGLLSAESSLLVFKLQNTLALFAALWLLYLHNRKFAENTNAAQWQYAALFAGLVLLYQPFWSVYRVGGQTTPTVFLLLVAAMIGHVRKRFWVSSACVVAAILIKPAFVFVLLPLVVTSGWRYLRNTAVILAGVGLVSLLILGWQVHAQFLQMMSQGLKNAYPWFYNSSLYVTAENLKLLASPPVDARLVGVSVLLVKLLMVTLCAYLIWQGRKQKMTAAAGRHFEFLMAVVFCLLVSQTVWEHYLSVLFLLLAYVVAAHRHFSLGALSLIAAIFILSIGQNLILVNLLRSIHNFDSAFELVSIGLFKSAPLLLTAIFLWLCRREFFNSHLAAVWAQTAKEK